MCIRDRTGTGTTTAGAVIGRNEDMFVPKHSHVEASWPDGRARVVNWDESLFWNVFYIKGGFLDADKAFEVLNGIKTYEMRMLQKTINSLKLNKNLGDNSKLEENWSPVIRIPASARIPENYITDSALRLSFYRRLSNFESQLQLESLLAELIDRFGRLPQDIINLANILKIKEKCKSLQIESLEVGNKGITIKFREGKVENISGLLAFIESDKNNIKPYNEKLFINIKKGNPLNLSYNILKNMEKSRKLP